MNEERTQWPIAFGSCLDKMNVHYHMQVGSFGVGGHVKLPGPTAKEPNVYNFGTPYKTMIEDLEKKDPNLYTRNGILNMLRRNMGVKLAPQRWQDSK